MSTLTIRGLDESVRARLKLRAAGHGRSMEAEVRDILTAAVSAEPTSEYGFGSQLRRLMGDGVELDLPARDDAPRAADFA